MPTGRPSQKDIDQKITDSVEHYVKESETAKLYRMELNRQNYEMYHGRQDMSHKMKGQSREFLPRQSMGVEHVAQFLHQGLLDFGDFFSANIRPGLQELEDTVFTATEVRELLKWQLKKAGFYNHTLDVLKSGILGSLMISKIGGCMKPKRRFVIPGDSSDKLLRSTDKVWQLEFSLPRQRNFHIDPTGKGLYKVEEIEMDIWELEALAKEHPKMFDKKILNRVIKSAGSGEGDYKTRVDKEAETNQPIANTGYRKSVRLRQLWGHVLDSNGKLLFESKTLIVANEKDILSRPKDFPSWDQEDPYVVAAIIRTPNSQWHKALADFPTQLNKAMNEIYNLIIDSGIQATFGLKQIREAWLEDPSEIEEGIYPGLSVGVNASCPPGQKVIERLDTGSAGGASEAMNAFNLTSQEHNQAIMQNDTRVGSLPQRAVKATEIVSAEQSITSVFSGIAKSIETEYVEKLLHKSWTQILQNWKKLDSEELKGILGKERFEQINKLSLKKIFSQTYGAFNFQVFGLTQTLNKIKDFRKLTGALQAISGNPELMEAFVRKYSFTKLLGEIMKALDINEDRIKLADVDQKLNQLDGEQEAPASPNPLNALSGQATQVPQALSGNAPLEQSGEETFSQVASFARG